MGAIYDQMQLRLAPEFRDYIHTAVLHVGDMILYEPPETPAHTARVAMAKLLIETNDPRAEAFVTKVVYRAVMHPPIRESIVKNGAMALEFADEEEVILGILEIWNETALAVWPTIVEDTSNGEGE